MATHNLLVNRHRGAPLPEGQKLPVATTLTRVKGSGRILVGGLPR